MSNYSLKNYDFNSVFLSDLTAYINTHNDGVFERYDSIVLDESKHFSVGGGAGYHALVRTHTDRKNNDVMRGKFLAALAYELNLVPKDVEDMMRKLSRKLGDVFRKDDYGEVSIYGDIFASSGKPLTAYRINQVLQKVQEVKLAEEAEEFGLISAKKEAVKAQSAKNQDKKEMYIPILPDDEAINQDGTSGLAEDLEALIYNALMNDDYEYTDNDDDDANKAGNGAYIVENMQKNALIPEARLSVNQDETSVLSEGQKEALNNAFIKHDDSYDDSYENVANIAENGANIAGARSGAKITKNDAILATKTIVDIVQGRMDDIRKYIEQEILNLEKWLINSIISSKKFQNEQKDEKTKIDLEPSKKVEEINRMIMELEAYSKVYVNGKPELLKMEQELKLKMEQELKLIHYEGSGPQQNEGSGPVEDDISSDLFLNVVLVDIHNFGVKMEKLKYMAEGSNRKAVENQKNKIDEEEKKKYIVEARNWKAVENQENKIDELKDVFEGTKEDIEFGNFSDWI